MTDNRPQLIRGKERERDGAGRGRERLLVIEQRNNRTFILMVCHTHTVCILLWARVGLMGCSEMLIQIPKQLL